MEKMAREGRKQQKELVGACRMTRDCHNSSKKKGEKIRSLLSMSLVLHWQERIKKKSDKRKSLSLLPLH